MEKCERTYFSALVQGSVFSLLLAFSLASAGQDTVNEPLDISTVHVEQININRADAATIARVLDGIGLTRAQAIVSYRDEFGEFTDVDDLLMVKGVGEVTVRNNQSRISFD